MSVDKLGVLRPLVRLHGIYRQVAPRCGRSAVAVDEFVGEGVDLVHLRSAARMPALCTLSARDWTSS